MINTELESKQKDFESKYHTDNLYKFLKENVDSCEDLVKLIESTSNPKVARKLIYDLIINRRILVSVEVGKLIHDFNDDAQATADFFEECIDKGLFFYDESRQQLVVKFIPDEEELNQVSYMLHPLPMLVHPKKIRNNFSSPYLTSSKSSQVYNSTTDEDVCLDVINALNGIPLRINAFIRDNGKNKWNSIEDLDDCLNPDDIPSYSSKKAMTKAQFDRFNRQQKAVLGFWLMDDQFYLPWKYDKRGRFYDDGYLIKVQGNDFQKALIDFDFADFVKKD